VRSRGGARTIATPREGADAEFDSDSESDDDGDMPGFTVSEDLPGFTRRLDPFWA
jgi:hypothetical protein